MDRLSAQKKVSVVRQYLSGLSYDEIAARSAVAKGTVANVVAELKAGTIPEAADATDHINLLRELSLDLKQSGLSPGQCAVGLAVLTRVRECGLDPAEVERLPLIVKAAGGEEKAREFVDLVYRIHQYQEESGLTLEQADQKLQKLEARAKELAPILKQVEECQKGIKQLAKRRDDLIPVVNNLEQKYSLLAPRVQELENREGELLRRIKDAQATIEKAQTDLAAASRQKQETIQRAEATLAKIRNEQQKLLKGGFSLQALRDFNSRIRAIAARHHIPIAELRERLLCELETLDKGLGLETLVKSNEAQLEKQQQRIAAAGKDLAGLRGTIATLEQQKSALEASIRTTREKIGEEIAKIIPAAREMVTQFAKELRLGNEDLLDEVKHLKDQTLEVGKEMGRYEGIVKVNQWLITLAKLVRGEDGLESEPVKSILLQVLRGGEFWMKRNQARIGFIAPIYTIRKLIEELEQWRV
ncbi:MAG: hypothetical protein HYX90_04380 [Chloroflexi bacterium]|nr:hypothetical protein [Chloroflexota bacterium]